MLAEFGMNTEPEAYFDLVPWEVLASTNHNFLVTERKRDFLRYSGGLTYFEVATLRFTRIIWWRRNDWDSQK